MTQDEAMKLAQKAGLYTHKDVQPEILAFANFVAAAEREACAKLCDDKHRTWRWDNEADSASGPRDCAAAIRARGELK